MEGGFNDGEGGGQSDVERRPWTENHPASGEGEGGGVGWGNECKRGGDGWIEGWIRSEWGIGGMSGGMKEDG